MPRCRLRVFKWSIRTVTEVFFQHYSKLNETMKLFPPMTLQKLPSGKAVILLKIKARIHCETFL